MKPHANWTRLAAETDQKLDRDFINEIVRRMCPSCSSSMVEQACKLKCVKCGYFEDCGDGMLP